MAKRVVITGLGILTSNGKGREGFWQALKEGKVGYKPVILLDTAEFSMRVAGAPTGSNTCMILKKIEG